LAASLKRNCILGVVSVDDEETQVLSYLLMENFTVKPIMGSRCKGQPVACTFIRPSSTFVVLCLLATENGISTYRIANFEYREANASLTELTEESVDFIRSDPMAFLNSFSAFSSL